MVTTMFGKKNCKTYAFSGYLEWKGKTVWSKILGLGMGMKKKKCSQPNLGNNQLKIIGKRGGREFLHMPGLSKLF